MQQGPSVNIGKGRVLGGEETRKASATSYRYEGREAQLKVQLRRFSVSACIYSIWTDIGGPCNRARFLPGIAVLFIKVAPFEWPRL